MSSNKICVTLLPIEIIQEPIMYYPIHCLPMTVTSNPVIDIDALASSNYDQTHLVVLKHHIPHTCLYLYKVYCLYSLWPMPSNSCILFWKRTVYHLSNRCIESLCMFYVSIIYQNTMHYFVIMIKGIGYYLNCTNTWLVCLKANSYFTWILGF